MGRSNNLVGLPALTSQTLLDKAIAYAAPSWAAQRQSSRNQLALSGGYTGARIDKAQLSRWMPMGGSPTTDIIRDLPMLRARSRDQMRNAPVALGAVNTTVSHVIGTGLTYTPAIDAEFLGLDDEQAEAWGDDAKRRFNAWANSPDCDLARQLDFYGLQELAFRTMLESGDAPIITPRILRNGKTRLAIQLLEADRVCNPARTADTATLIDGVELDANTGEAIALHVAKFHPGGSTPLNAAATDWTRVVMRGATGRRNALLIFKPLRPSQVRGVPLIAPILEPLKQLNRWSEAELNAAVISGINATFIKMDPDAFDALYDEDAQGAIVDKASGWSGEMESGKAINLLPGEDISSPTPGRPNPAFDPFWQAMVRQIGMALEMPYEVLVMHFQSSYSAARAALLMAWKAFRSRRDLMAKMMCQPVFELWLADEVAEGRISAPGFFQNEIVKAAWCAAIWTGDGPGSIDPSKEVDAAAKRVALGISTKQAESILHDGVDWEQKHEQRVKEINAEKRDGIYIQPAGSPVQTSAQPAAEDAPPAKDDGSAAALVALSARMDSLADKAPANITIHTPPVTYHAGDTHVAPAAVTVEGHEINVSLPEGCIQLEAVVQAPAVTVQSAPAQVTIVPTPAVQETYTRDGEGNLTGKIVKPL
jgi:lambda family phage portal protein